MMQVLRRQFPSVWFCGAARGALLGGLMALSACGGENSAIVVKLQPFTADLFAGVSVVRLEATGTDMPTMRAEAVRASGQIRLPSIPFGTNRRILVEGIDDQLLVVARGQSDPFEVTANTPDEVIVAVTRCNLKLSRDEDGDTYGGSTEHSGCEQVGWVSLTGDCDDKDAEAHPGQTQYFSRTRVGAGGFDFDCNNSEEKQYPSVVDCSIASPCRGEGWVDNVPECGKQANWYTCKKDGSECIPQNPTPRTQACR